MNVTEETIEATLDTNGQLRLTHPPGVPPGPVRVTIRVAAGVGPKRGLSDVIREMAAEQRARGFPGRSTADLRQKRTLAWPRTSSGTGNWTPRTAVPSQGGRVISTVNLLTLATQLAQRREKQAKGSRVRSACKRVHFGYDRMNPCF